MNSRKRQAPDNLSTRRNKQPRLALKGYGGGTPSPSEREGLLSRWNRIRMELVALSADTLTVVLSKLALRESSDQRESESPDFSSSSAQQISSPAVSLLFNGSTDFYADYSTPSRTVLAPPCKSITLEGRPAVQPTTLRPNGTISTDITPPETKFARHTQYTQLNDRDITPKLIHSSGQVTPTGAAIRALHSSTLSRGAPLKPEKGTREPGHCYRQPFTHGTPENADLPSSSRTTSHSLLKDSPFPAANSSQTSWSSAKDDLSDRIKHLDSSPPLASQRFRFSTSSSRSHPRSHPSPDSHISPPKPSIALGRRTSGQYNRNRPHIHERVHKAKVQRERVELREELKKEYHTKRRTGNYISTFSDFLGYKDYEKKLQDISLDLVSYPPFSRPPQSDLKLKSLAHSAGSSTGDNPVRRALDSATATLNSPKPPKPNIPNLDRIRILHRTRDDEIERRIRPPITPLPSCLPVADDANVSAILLQYGVISKFAREQVSDQDIARLLPGQWLNDEVINFYGAMILARSEESKENPASQRNGKITRKAIFLDAHYFSSFFWSKLTKEGYEKGRLAKWTKKMDIFTKDIILIPVNHQNAHWTAAAINFKEKRVESYDSMGMAKEKVFTHLRSYINAEHVNKKKKPFDFTDWKNWAPDTTPQQENGYDCGVFTCQFLESLSRGEESFRFSQKNMPYLRRRMIWEIGNGTLRDDHY